MNTLVGHSFLEGVGGALIISVSLYFSNVLCL